ncbi:hypothetical protein E2562_017377, partial [Oryza meyeriana var. granulata]
RSNALRTTGLNLPQPPSDQRSISPPQVLLARWSDAIITPLPPTAIKATLLCLATAQHTPTLNEPHPTLPPSPPPSSSSRQRGATAAICPPGAAFAPNHLSSTRVTWFLPSLAGVPFTGLRLRRLEQGTSQLSHSAAARALLRRHQAWLFGRH